MTASKVRRGAAAGFALATSLLLGACASAAEAGADLAGTIRIEQYREVRTDTSGDTATVYFVGLADIDVEGSLTARGYRPEDRRAFLQPGFTGPGIQEAPYLPIDAVTVEADGFRCTILISRFKAGGGHVLDPDGLSPQDAADVRSGRYWLIKTDTTCT